MKSSTLPFVERAWLRFGLMAAVLLSPILLTLVLVGIHGSYTLTDYIPRSTDEKYYWHQIQTFQEAGFNGGYYTIEERPSPATFSHFYTKGPVFPTLYGLPAQILGWETYTGALFNLAIVTIALGTFLYTTRPDTRQLTALLLALATFWPLLLFVDKMLQEAIMAAMAIFTTAMFADVLAHQDDFPLQRKLIYTAILFGMALIRGGTWSALFIPLYIISSRRKTLIPLAIELVKGTALALASFLTFGQMLLPGSNFGSTLPTSRAGINNLANKIGGNLSNFNQGRDLWIVQRYQVLGLSLFALVEFVRPLWSKRQSLNDLLVDRPRGLWEAVFHLVNLGGILAANIVLYDMFDWRDYRVLAPHLLISLLLLVACKRYRIVALLIVINLVLISGFFGAWDELHIKNYAYQDEDLTATLTNFEDSLDGVLVYDPDAASPWCNTLLLVDVWQVLEVEFVPIPAGIGISYTRDFSKLDKPPRSAYLLFPTDGDWPYQDSPDLDYLTDTPYGPLYRNQQVECP